MLAAVSGGADSTALLYLLARLGQPLGAAHVHHGLRDEADDDLQFVERIARRLGVPFFEEHVTPVPDGHSPEARARHLRYSALERLRVGHGYAWIATAHTEDDQAETVLLRAIRGSAPAGLSGIRPVDGRVRLIRPLLGARRAELRRYLEARGLGWREDRTNSDVQIPRNRIRHEVLSPLEAAHPGAVRALARLASDARELGDWMRAEAAPGLRSLRRTSDGGLELDRAPLLALPHTLRRLAVAEWLQRGGLEAHLSREHLERVERLVLSDAPRGKVSLPRDMLLVRDGERLRLGDRPLDPLGLSKAGLPARLRPPLGLELPHRGVRFEWHRSERVHAAGLEGLRLPEAFEDEILLRSPRPGDRLCLAGDSRARPLRELFRVARWSSWQRRDALVATWRGEVVWVVGLAGADLRPGFRGHAWELRAVRLSAAPPTC